MSRKESPPTDDRLEAHLETIRSVLADMRFGECVITVQDGEVVQIARTDKVRVTTDATRSPRRNR